MGYSDYLKPRTSSSSVPGVDYQSLLDAAAPQGSGGYSAYRSGQPSPTFQRNLALIRKQQEEYAAQQKKAEADAAARQGGSAPLWAKALNLAGKAFEYTSGSTYTEKIPVIGDIQRAAQRNVPGLKTALQIASNPLTYLTLGEGGIAGAGLNISRAALEQGLAAGAVGGAGAYAGEKYGETGLPGSKYAPAVGGLVGTVIGAHGMGKVQMGGLGELPLVGRSVPESLAGVGTNPQLIARRALMTAKATAKAADAAIAAGHPLIGHTLYTQDGRVFTYHKPPPIEGIQLTADDLGTPTTLLQDAANNSDPNFVYATTTRANAYKIASTGELPKGQPFHQNMTTLEPDEVAVRIPAEYAKPDPVTGRMVQTTSLGKGDVHIYTNDARSGDKAWKSIGQLVTPESQAPWRAVKVTDPEQAVKFAFDGQHWLFNLPPEEAAVLNAAGAVHGMNVNPETGGRAISGQVTATQPVPEGQVPMPLAGEMGATREPLTAVPDAAAEAAYADRRIPGTNEPTPGYGGINEGAYQAPMRMPAPQVTPPEINPSAFHEEVVTNSLRDGGGTFDVVNGEPIIPKAFSEGYTGTGTISTKTSVGVMRDRSVIIPQDRFTPDSVQLWERLNSDVLNDGTHHMGTWVKDGEVHIDVVELTSPKKAVALGLENVQHSVFNMRTGNDIPVPGVSEEAVQAQFEAARAHGLQMLGEAPAAPATPEMLNLTHYSKDRLTSIDPERAGTSGVAGAELNTGGPKVSHFYPEGQAPEKSVLDRGGTVKHSAQIPANRVLDLNSPEGQAVVARANEAAKTRMEAEAAANGGWKVNEGAATTLGDWRQQAKDEGWLATTNSDRTQNPYGNIQAFNPLEVTHVNDIPVVKEIPSENSTLKISADGHAEDVAFETGELPEVNPRGRSVSTASGSNRVGRDAAESAVARRTAGESLTIANAAVDEMKSLPASTVVPSRITKRYTLAEFRAGKAINLKGEIKEAIQVVRDPADSTGSRLFRGEDMLDGHVTDSFKTQAEARQAALDHFQTHDPRTVANVKFRRIVTEPGKESAAIRPLEVNPRGRATELTYGGKEGERVFTKEVVATRPGRENSMTREYRINPDGTAEMHNIRYRNGMQWESEPWKPVAHAEGLEERIRANGFEEQGAAATADPQLQKIVDAIYTQLDKSENMSLSAGRAAVKKLEAAGIDTADAQAALDDLEAVATGSTAAERADAWDTFKNAINDTQVDEVASAEAQRSTAVAQGLITDRPPVGNNPAAHAAGQKILDSLIDHAPPEVNPRGRAASAALTPEAAAAKGLYTERAIQNGNSFYTPDGQFVGVDWTSPNAPTEAGRGLFTHYSLSLLLGHEGQDAALQAGYVRVAKGPVAMANRVTGNAGLSMEAATRDDLAMAANQALRGGERPDTIVSWDVGVEHGKTSLKDLIPTEDINPRGRETTTGAIYGLGKKEAGNWLPDTIKQMVTDNKMVSGVKGTNTVQDVLGKMAAADFLMHNTMDWDAFGSMVQNKYGIDLSQSITVKSGVQKGTGTLQSFIDSRMNHYVEMALSKPRYNDSPLSNAKGLLGLMHTVDPATGQWYSGTLPAVYELIGEEDGNMFLKFLATTSIQKTPRDNVQLALDVFADYKLGYFNDPKYVPYGVPKDISDSLRYVMSGGEVSGLKVNPFHQNLELRSFNSAVDRWEYRIFGYDDAKVQGNKNITEIIMHQHRLLGDETGMLPQEVQARLWTAGRNMSEGKNIINEPYEELMLGRGKYSDTGQLIPDLEGAEGLPTAKQTLQHILDMRDKGIIDLPTDTKAATQKAQQLVEDLAKMRQDAASTSMERATALAKEYGVPIEADDTPLQIMDKVYEHQGVTARGPKFGPEDAAYDAEIAAQKQLAFAGMEPNPDAIVAYDPTAMAARSKELDTWAEAGALDHPTLPDDLKQVRDDFRARVDQMTPEEVAKRFNVDARTPNWQKTVLQEQRPTDVTGAVREEVRARPVGVVAPAESAGAGIAQSEKLAVLKDDLRKAGVPEERIDEIAQNALGKAQSPEQATEAGQAIRGASRAEALSPNPYGQEAYARERAAGAPKVNGRPVIAMSGIHAEPAAQAAGAQIENIIASSSWAPVVEQQFSDAVDFSVGILERTMYRLGGTGPKSGGLYYQPGEIGFYNETAGKISSTTGYKISTEVPRAEVTIHLNSVDLFQQARNTASVEKIPLHAALADETLETALHETAHDLALHMKEHLARGTSTSIGKDEQFLRVLNEMKANGADDIEAQRVRIRAVFKKMDEDGTLVKWENDNARIRRTDRAAVGQPKPGDTVTFAVGEHAQGNVAGVSEQAAARAGRGEGVPTGAPSGGGEPGVRVQPTGGTAESRLAAAAGLPERSTPRVTRTGFGGEPGEPVNPRGRPTADESGAPGQPDITRITTPAPQLLEKAGAGKVFEKPVPAGERISAAPRNFDDVKVDIFKNNAMRKATERLAQSNPFLKRVLTAVGGKAGTAVTDLEKDIATYAVKTESDKSRIVGMMAELRQETRPFDKLESNLTNATDWRGKQVVVSFGDVLSHPNNFILNAAQEGYINRYHQIVDELVADAKEQGIDIHELGFTKGPGSHYIPRWTQGAEGVDIEGRYLRGGLGTKQKFEKPRYYDTEAQGIAHGVAYHDSEQALQNFAEAIMRRTRDKEIIDRVKGYGRTASELAGPEARAPLDAQIMKLKDARSQWEAAKRELGKLTGKNIAVQAGRKTLSPADVRSMVSENADVKAARTTLSDLIKRRDEISSTLAETRTPAAQAKWELHLDAVKGKIADAQDALKAARKTARVNITGADIEDVTKAKTGSRATIKAAKERVAAAEARYKDVFTATKSVKARYTSVLNEKKASFYESGAKFGMGGDVIPVRQTRELPGLQGRIFPSEVMDVLEKGLGDKASGALTKLASVNDLARMFATSTDFGATMLQGLPVLAYNPRAWAVATAKSIHAFFDPKVLQQYYAANRAAVNEISNYGGGLSMNEFFHSSTGGESMIGKVAKSGTPLFAKPAQTVERFGVSFDTFLDVAKVEMWKALSPMAKGDSSKLEELGRFVRNISGTTSTARLGASTTQRQVESLLMFSPRFSRSVFALGAQAFEGGIGGRQAQKALGGFIFGSMALYAGIKTAMHQGGYTDEPFNWKDFSPTQGGKFMSIKVGDNYIGLGGSMRGALQLLGTTAAAAVTSPEKFLSTETVGQDANPFLKFLRGRSSPAAGEGWNLLTGKNAIGQEYDSRAEWLNKVPDAFIPFAVQSVIETEGGTGQKFGVFGAQTIGLRTFPESKTENLSVAMKDSMKKLPTDLAGFSQAERDDIQGWADLTKYQKQVLLQRFPELSKQLDAKEQQFWTAYKQVQADTDAAKRELGQKLLTTMQKQATGTALTAEDLTPEQYRNAMADVAMKSRAATAAIKGANVITGLGGDYTTAGGPRTHRQAVMDAYYQAVDSVNFIDPVTGQMDFNKKDELSSIYLAKLSKADQNIISQEQGAEYDAMARELKAAKLTLAAYWGIGDMAAQQLGFSNAQEVDLNGNPRQQKRYNSVKSKMQERLRRSNPEIDSLLVQWGYVSKSIREQGRKQKTTVGQSVSRKLTRGSL